MSEDLHLVTPSTGLDIDHEIEQDTAKDHDQPPTHLLHTTPDVDLSNESPVLMEAGQSKSATAGGSDTSPKVKIPTYDPRALLNPKAAKRAPDESEIKDIQSNNTGDPNATIEDADIGMGSLIERVHGVGKREAHAEKRRKVNHDEDIDDNDKKQKATFTGAGKGGPVAEYVKKKREEGQAESGPVTASSIVDLTADDDDLQYVKSNDADMREVCLGTINAKINAHKVPAASNKALSGFKELWPPTKITLRRQLGSQIMIEVFDKLGTHFGHVDFAVASALGPLLNGVQVHKMRLSPILPMRQRKPDEKPGMSISELLPAQITIFSSLRHASGIGKTLSVRQFYLSNPTNPEGKEVHNPHAPNLKVIPNKALGASVIAQQSASYSVRSVEEIKSDVVDMFDKLINVEEIPEMEAGTDYLATELMSHQKQALHFLTQRETPTKAGEDPTTPLWKTTIKNDRSKVYYNVITGLEVRHVEDALGGIFADMMGLGKTLSLLSRVCTTIDEAREFGEQPLSKAMAAHDTVERNTKATLIVCPKSVLSNWDEQIKGHLQKNKLRFYLYHGSERIQDVDELADYDIVITSYTTAAIERTYSKSKYKALGKLNWFRIILDEAHMIRNQTTSTFAACCALASPRRWAVTGTPVQNKLDDLGALIKFLNITPFSEKGNFEKHFLAPFKMADVQVLDNLRLLVDSITLRRSKDKIDLPDKVDRVVKLRFSEEELGLYEAFAKDSGNKLRAMMSANGLRGKGYAHMLTAITRLRLLCAHGRELLSQEDLRTLDGMSYGTAIELGEEDDDKPALTEEQIYSMYYLLRESNMNLCARCGNEIKDGESSLDTDDESDDDDEGVVAYMTPCYHVVCPNCIGAFRAAAERKRTSDNYTECPVCAVYIKHSFPEVTRQGINAEVERREEIRTNPRKAKNGGNYGGPHTKVKALVAMLLENRRESEILYGEPPIRSVVFSGWTQYLDLIEIALHEHDIGFLRLDGKMSVPARTKVLEQFRTDPSVSVILVSIKAGGQGLNFTAGNKVYMMEPQFNPGVELQAIDRVHRLGQTRDVEIVKFIMQDSFEESIVELQKKKMALAQTAFKDGKRMTKDEEMKKRMEDLRSLFK